MFIDLNGIQLHVLDHGRESCRRPVLLITGLGGDGRAWGPQIDLFADGGRVLVPDHRGTGKSTRTLAGLTIPQHAEDMASLVRHLGTGPVHVVGSSTGGAIAQVMALEHPDTVASLCLAASWGRSDAYFQRWFELRRRVLATMSPAEHVDLTQLLLHAPAFWQHRRDVIEPERRSMMQSGGEFTLADARMSMLLDHDVLDRLATLDVPTLVIVGALDIVCPPYLSRELARAIPNAQLDVLADAGHYLHVEDPTGFHGRVRRFHDSLEPARRHSDPSLSEAPTISATDAPAVTS